MRDRPEETPIESRMIRNQHLFGLITPLVARQAKITDTKCQVRRDSAQSGKCIPMNQAIVRTDMNQFRDVPVDRWRRQMRNSIAVVHHTVRREGAEPVLESEPPNTRRSERVELKFPFVAVPELLRCDRSHCRAHAVSRKKDLPVITKCFQVRLDIGPTISAIQRASEASMYVPVASEPGKCVNVYDHISEPVRLRPAKHNEDAFGAARDHGLRRVLTHVAERVRPLETDSRQLSGRKLIVGIGEKSQLHQDPRVHRLEPL